MDRPGFGDHLRRWRRACGLSQIDLAAVAGVSARHISFLETGRAQPSREMVLKLAQSLAVPLRERNPMLASAGFAAMYRTRAWDDPDLRLALQSVRTVLAAHMPHPALALDRLYHVVEANAAATALLQTLLPQGDAGTINVIRATLHPQGLAPHIVNFTDWRADVLMRLDRQAQQTGDAELSALHREVSAYPLPAGCPAADRAPAAGAPGVILPLELRWGQQVLRFITTMTVFGSPHDIVLQELAIETFFAADEETARFLRETTATSEGAAARARVKLPVFQGRGGLVKSVDPLSNKALLEALGDDA
jgi:transcriptional regulator with XRE-family HTH domain